MKIKVQDLSTSQLNWAVVVCEKLVFSVDKVGDIIIEDMFGNRCLYAPVELHDQGMVIVDREGISTIRCDDDYETDSKGFCTNKRIPVWAAEHGGGHSQQTQYEGENYPPRYEIDASDCYYGRTLLEAAMKCYVANKLGIEIYIPDELISK